MRSIRRPTDHILDFAGPSESAGSAKSNPLECEQAIQFDSLPIGGWYDQMNPLDYKCNRNCVKDCSCVYHCSLIIA